MKTLPYIAISLAIVALFSAACTSTNPSNPSNLRVRKSVTRMTTEEKADFVSAVKALKTVPSPYDPTLNYYDQFVKWHYLAFFCDAGTVGGDGMFPAHMNPGFLPWHRVYLDLFERALRDVSGKDVTIPYWDWTDPSAQQVLFSDELVGGDGDPSQGYAVTSGPFQKDAWVITISDDVDIDSVFFDHNTSPNVVPYLTRRIGKNLNNDALLPTSAEVLGSLSIPTYDSAPWDSSVDTTISFRNSLEGWRGSAGNECEPNGTMDVIGIPGERRSTQHNIVHVYVGGIWEAPDGNIYAGSMCQATSPNDPVFWIHHANIDRIWSGWMKRHGKNYASGGEMMSGLNEVLMPWHFRMDGLNTPAAVMDESVLGYQYDELP
jgi:tyrosinase